MVCSTRHLLVVIKVASDTLQPHSVFACMRRRTDKEPSANGPFLAYRYGRVRFQRVASYSLPLLSPTRTSSPALFPYHFHARHVQVNSNHHPFSALLPGRTSRTEDLSFFSGDSCGRTKPSTNYGLASSPSAPTFRRFRPPSLARARVSEQRRVQSRSEVRQQDQSTTSPRLKATKGWPAGKRQ